MALTKSRLGEYIELREETNDDLRFGVEDVRGVNNLIVNDKIFFT